MESRKFEKKDAASLLNQLAEKLDTGVHIIDEQGRTILYNKKMSEIEGMKQEQVMQQSLHEIFRFHEKDRSTLLEALNNRTSSHGVQQTYFNKHGAEINTLNDTFPVITENGIIAAVELSRDITKIEKLIRSNIKKSYQARFTFDQIVGETDLIKNVVEASKKATRTSSSVLIIGETGTGKELFAQSIHTGSKRSAKPFISQNCAAIPEHLVESILFGTKSGAFTGSKEREGLFEEAEGGTLLLDEINSLSISLQAKLLRVLQERKIRRIGDTKEKKVNVRIIATMNEDPQTAIAENRLRSDLFYRLSVVTVIVPPLRDRKDDIDKLASVFLGKLNKLFSMEVNDISADVMNIFTSYHWPGNVRELEHVIEGAMNIMDGSEKKLELKHLPAHFRPVRSIEPEPAEKGSAHEMEKPIQPLHDVLFQQEKKYVKYALDQYSGNISKTAEALGLSRQSLQYRLKKLGFSTYEKNKMKQN
ncbi:sigma-54 interaction domain-containing protein [Alteribacillus sp. HJP-4]|uniref:sigma-54 interaction domain-containing protein n=1 Tax=Alteribacillus sp. HJP-4 TaxID=2775394 RepID=UPI0035CCCCEE